MIKTFIIADFVLSCILSTGFNKILLSEIAVFFSGRGIRSSKIRKKCESLFFVCQKDQEEVYVSILSLYAKKTDTIGKCFISFSNYYSEDKSIETESSNAVLFSGKLIEETQKLLFEFLNNCKWITDTHWQTKDSFMDYIKKVDEFGHF